MNKILTALILLLSLSAVIAQDENNTSIYNSTEKVILHTDRDIYLINENIWFTAYCFIGNESIKNNISNVLYVEIYNNSREFILKKKFKIINGKVNGMLTIPSEFSSGNYALRAYTQFSKNFSPNTYFTRIISILNPNMSASIYNPQNNVGKNTIIQSNKNYSITAVKNDKNIDLNIHKSETNRRINESNIFTLEIVSKDLEILSESRVFLADKNNHIKFTEKQLNPGINYFILKSEDNKIAAIYAYLKNPQNYKLSIQVEKTNYQRRSLVKVNIIDPYQSNKLKDVSIAIVKKATINNIEKNIRYVLNNGVCLGNFLQNILYTTALSDEELSLLMNQYNSLLSENYEDYVFGKNINEIPWMPEIRDVSISGIAYSKKTHTPVSDLPVYVSSFNNNPQLHIYKTSQTGRFIFSLNNLQDYQNLYICANSNLGQDIELRINNDFVREFDEGLISPMIIDTSSRELIEQMYINNQANTIFKSNTNTLNNTNKQLPFVFSYPDDSYKTEDYVFTSTLETFFREIISGLIVRKRNDQYSIGIVDKNNKMIYDYPLVLVDNIPVFNINEIMKITPSVIDKIDLYKQSVVINDFVINGIILINTNTDNFGDIKLPENAIFLDYQTLSDHYNFVGPDYSAPEARNNRKADFRTTLYWNPELSFKDQKTISFYTSDHCSEYDIIVRGYTEDGMECYGRTTVNVVK